MRYLTSAAMPTGHRRGFTLIELLVVIAIIGVLASIVMASLNGARTKARDAQRISDLKTLQGMLENYFSSNGFYPNPVSLCPGHPVSQIYDAWPNCWKTLVFASPFLPAVPVDPTDYVGSDVQTCYSRSDCHVYIYCVDSTTANTPAENYILGVNLENPPSVAQTNPSSPVSCSISTGPNVYWIGN